MFSSRKSTGFTLIEVLISLVVLAIGLLGLAALQGRGLQNNQNAYARSQATQFAYDLADRMRANMKEASNNNYESTYITQSPATASKVASCSNKAIGCSRTQMAQNDLYEWYKSLTAALPSASVTIGHNGNIINVSIKWDEDHNGDLSNDNTFITSFQL